MHVMLLHGTEYLETIEPLKDIKRVIMSRVSSQECRLGLLNKGGCDGAAITLIPAEGPVMY